MGTGLRAPGPERLRTPASRQLRRPTAPSCRRLCGRRTGGRELRGALSTVPAAAAPPARDHRPACTSYGTIHLLPFFGTLDLALLHRCPRLRASDQVPGAVSVDDWVSGMLAKPWRNNRNQPMQGKQVSIKFVQNVLVLLGQCFDTAVKERPALQVNPAPDIGLPKQDRREMHVLEDRADYGRLRRGMNVHFVPLLDFLVGTGVRWGEAAELLTRRLHLDSPHPRVDVRVVLKWVGRKWKLGRPRPPDRCSGPVSRPASWRSSVPWWRPKARTSTCSPCSRAAPIAPRQLLQPLLPARGALGRRPGVEEDVHPRPAPHTRRG